MTLKVGERYLGVFAGAPVRLGIVKIEAFPSGGAEITFRAVGWLPRWLWFLGPRSTDYATQFINRLDLATHFKPDPEPRYVREVEVRYKGY